MIRRIFTTLCTLVLLAGLAHAQETPTSELSPLLDQSVIEATTPPGIDSDDWQFTINPYVWGPWIWGNTGFGGISTDFDISLRDVLENLDMMAFLSLEARKGRWGLVVDGFYAKLGTRFTIPEPFPIDSSLAMKLGVVEGGIAYRLIDTARFDLDVLAGARWMYVGLKANMKASDSAIHGFTSDVTRAAFDAAGSAVRRRLDGVSSKVSAGVNSRLDAVRAEARAAVEARAKALGSELQSKAEKARSVAEMVVQKKVEDLLDQLPGGGENIPERVRDRIKELANAAAEAKIAEAKAALGAEAAAAADRVTGARAAVRDAAKGRVARAKASARKKARKKLEKAEKKLARALAEEIGDRFPGTIDASREWVDPIVGTRAHWQITDPLYLALYGDVGGFGVGSDLTWQAAAMLGWRVRDWCSIELGYRYLYVDYLDGPFRYEMNMGGPVFGARFRF